MSSVVFNRIKGRAKTGCCLPSPRRHGTTMSESARIAALGCLYTVIDHQIVPASATTSQPVSNATQPSSVTTARLRDAVLRQADDPYNPVTRFSGFFPAPVPPPQFLQVPRERVSYEPYARIVPCIVVGVPKLPVVTPVVSSPDAPLLAGLSNDQSITLIWTIPPANGSPIIDYEYTITDGADFLSLGTTKKYGTVRHLTNGTLYTLALRAVNGRGAGALSNTVQLRPGRVPDAPAPLSAYAGNRTINLVWTIPYDGGMSVTGYEYTTDGQTYRAITPYSSTRGNIGLLSASNTPLQNGTQYTVAVRAVNAIGPSLPTITWRATPHEDYVVIYLTDIAIEGPPNLWTLSYDVTVRRGSQLTIDRGLNLLIPSDTTLTNQGLIEINGTITVNGNFDNQALVQNNTDGIVELLAIATEGPAGIWTVFGDYTIAATQTLTVPVDTLLVIPQGYTILNFGTILINGRITENGNLINNGSIIVGPDREVLLSEIATETPLGSGAWILNSDATIAIRSTLTIPALNTLTIPANLSLLVQGQLVIDGTLVNNGTLANEGKIINNSNTIMNNATFTNSGTIENVGTVFNSSRGTISSSGVFNNSSATSILTNLGSLVSSGPSEVFNNSGNFNSANGVQNWTTVPTVPTLISAVGGNRTITLTWTPPTTNGGYAITDYLYSFNPTQPPISLGTTGTTAVIQTLTNGEAYTVSIVAKNLMGTSARSDSLTATPATSPTAPTTVVAVAGNRTIGLSWTAPTDTGGFPITSYLYTTDGWVSQATLVNTGTTATITATSSTPSTPLANGTSYTVAILAQNSVGPGARSATSTVTPRSVPNAPTLTLARGGDARITLSWTAPTDTGGSPITDYSYTTDGGATYVSLQTAGGTATITAPSATPSTPFVNGTPYTVAIAARNSVGLGPNSTSLTTTPANPPSAPILISATGGNASIALVWVAGSSGGTPITNYVYTTDGTTYASLATTGTTATITARSTGASLVNGTGYTVLVAAVNAVDRGSNSNSQTAIPATVSSPPTLISAVGGSGSITLSWTPPSDTGGSVISDYQYTTDAGQTYVTLGTSGTTAVITKTSYGAPPLSNLVSGRAYTVYIRAKNAIGNSAPSNFETGVPTI